MTKFKGTKGKWKVKLDYEISNFPHVEISHKRVITVEGKNADEPKYNAVLISKAPEMLEMLENIVNNYELLGLSNEVKKLIKEATEL